MDNGNDKLLQPAQLRGLSPGVAEQLKAYVYLLVDPRDGQVFYVGKGNNSRVLAHRPNVDDDSLSEKLKRVRDIERSGQQVSLLLLRTGMSDDEAFHVEGAAIDIFSNAFNLADGRHSRLKGMMSVPEYIALHEPKPANIVEPVILITIGRVWRRDISRNPELLREVTSKYWDCRPETKVATPPKYAFAVAGAIIRETYRINGWARQDMRLLAAPGAFAEANLGKTEDRCIFDLTVADELRHYVGQSVAHLRMPGAANPIQYVNAS